MKSPIRMFLPIFLILFLFVPKLSFSLEKNYDESTVIVSVKNYEKLEQEYNVKSFLFENVYSVYVPEGKTVEEFISELSSKDYVEFAEPNYLFEINIIPNDEFVDEQWNLRNIRAFDAWNITTGSSDVVVGVIDTGVDYTNLDLEPNLWKNPDEICNNGQDDDGNGYIDDCYGWNAVNEIGDEPTIAFSDISHGTHVAGIIAAVGNNGIGIAGIGWNIKVLSCNASSDGLHLSTEDIAQCFRYILEQKFLKGVNVVAINGSFGGPNYSKAAEKFLKTLDKFGVVFVVAAGNLPVDNDFFPEYPCSYRTDNVICVGATDRYDKRAVFSKFGFGTIDIFAPGEDILSTVQSSYYDDTVNKYGYAYASGTSMAAPHVAGAIALLKSIEPNITPQEIKERLLATSDSLSSLFGYNRVCGRLNLYNLLTNTSPAKFCTNIYHDKEYEFSIFGQAYNVSIQTGIIRNTGKNPLTVSSIYLSNPQYFYILTDECTGKTLNFMQDCKIKLGFVNPGVNYDNDDEALKTKLYIDTSVGQYSFNLKGNTYFSYGTGRYLEISKKNVYFRNVSVGSTAEDIIRIKNISDDKIKLIYSYSQNPLFSISTDGLDKPCSNETILEENEYCFLKITYTPNSNGIHETLLSISALDPDEDEDFNKMQLESTLVSIKGTTEDTPAIATEPDTTIIKIVKEEDGNKTKLIRVKNTGNLPLTIEEISFIRNNPGFALNLNYGDAPCGTISVLNNGESCTFGIVFLGNDKDKNYTTFLRIKSNDKLERNKVLTVVGIIDKLKFKVEPSKIKFTSTMIGKEEERIITIYNKSEDYPLDITDISIGDNTNFSVDTFGGDKPCGEIPAEVYTEDYCTISVKFRPQSQGKIKTRMFIRSGTQEEDVSLEGEALEPIYPLLTVQPETYDFGEVLVGHTSKETFEIRNDGFSDLTIEEIKIKGKEFTLNLLDGSSPCGNLPITLAPGQTCNFSVSFSPEKDKQVKSKLEIRSNDPYHKKLSVELYGKGRYESAVINVSPQEYDFGTVLIGTYKDKTFYVENTGELPLRIDEIKIKGKSFSIVEDNCSAPVAIAPGDSCTFKVRFSPVKDKREKGSIEIRSNDKENSKLKISLYGQGKKQFPSLAIEPDPEEIDFGKVRYNDSKKVLLKLVNTGNAPLHVYQIRLKAKDNAYSLEPNMGSKACGGTENITVPAGDYCTVEIVFTPNDIDEYKGSLEIRTNDPNNKKVKIKLLGFGRVYPAPAITLSDRDVEVEKDINQDLCSFSTDIIVNNSGEDELVFSYKTETDEELKVETNCGFFRRVSLLPGESCVFSFVIKNCSAKEKLRGKTLKGKLHLYDINDPTEDEIDVDVKIRFKKNEYKDTESIKIYEAGYPTEPFTYVGEISFPYILKVYNRSGRIVNVEDVYMTNNEDFKLEFTGNNAFARHVPDYLACGSNKFTLYPDEYCYLYVYFVPKTAGIKKTTINVKDETGEISKYEITLSAVENSRKYIVVDPEVFDEFDFITPGNVSQTKEIKVRNYYETPVEIDQIVLEDDNENNFELVENFGDKPCNQISQIQPNDYCTVGIRFRPQSNGIKRAKIVVYLKKFALSTVEGEIVGRSIDYLAPHIVLKPRQIVMGLQYPKTVSSPQQIKILNIGNDVLNITDIKPSDSESVLISYDYGDKPCNGRTLSLQPGDYCTIGVVYTPQDENDTVGKVIVISDDEVFPVATVRIYSDPDTRFSMSGGCSFGNTTTLPAWLVLLLIPILRRVRVNK